MKRTIITIYGRANEGKSETIKKVFKNLFIEFPQAKLIKEKFKDSNDIYKVIKIDNIVIGFESEGDPKSRGLKTLSELANEKIQNEKKGCDIIICASRSKGETVHNVLNVAKEHEYNVIWISSFFSRQLNTEFLNKRASENIIEIIKGLILDKL
ncbi:hypothetical protein [Aureivirga marina]|uniref:hypothetical protein n=1 Tax=Aureivirga marina TaxID=1182451 RepID=UPI0018CAFAB5|nr:hypothetical protein [Aureivirga marina]